MTEEYKSNENQKTVNSSPEEQKQGINIKKFFIFGIIGLITVSVGVYYYIRSTTYVSTDDAYIEGHMVQIAPKVSGNIIKVYVDDNEKVKEGQIIAEIDPIDYQVLYNQAEARLESAVAKQKGANVNVELVSITSAATFGQTNAALEQATHDVSAAKAEMHFAQVDFDRYTKAYSEGVVSKQAFDKIYTNYKVVQEKLNAVLKFQEQAFEKARGSNTSKEQVEISNTNLKGATAEIKQLKAALAQAKLNLLYTKIYAPQSGSVTGKSIEKGSYVQVGQPLLAIVPEKRWVVANFKETQLNRMRIGQSVFVKVDAYPGKIFKGKIDSIQAASGSKSSLFPPENAVGSFVKVVQRVPVKIIFTEKLDAKYAIMPGMSVIPEVKVR